MIDAIKKVDQKGASLLVHFLLNGIHDAVALFGYFTLMVTTADLVAPL